MLIGNFSRQCPLPMLFSVFLLHNSIHSVYLLGETDKWLPVSQQRLTALTPIQDQDLVLTVAGAQGESVSFSYLLDGTLQTVTCNFKQTSSLLLSISNKTCWCLNGVMIFRKIYIGVMILGVMLLYMCQYWSTWRITRPYQTFL